MFEHTCRGAGRQHPVNGYIWNTPSSGKTPAGAPYDNLFLSGSSTSDSISNPVTTSVIRVTVQN